jgi:hypothetical protein
MSSGPFSWHLACHLSGYSSCAVPVALCSSRGGNTRMTAIRGAAPPAMAWAAAARPLPRPRASPGRGCHVARATAPAAGDRDGGGTDEAECSRRAAAVPDPDLAQARPLPRQARAERNAEASTGRAGVRIARDNQGARSCQRSGQDAPGHRFVALRPVPVRAHGPVGQCQAQRPGCGTFPQDRQVTGGDPAIAEPQQRVIGQPLACEKRPGYRRQVLRPFQGQPLSPNARISARMTSGFSRTP